MYGEEGVVALVADPQPPRFAERAQWAAEDKSSRALLGLDGRDARPYIAA